MEKKLYCGVICWAGNTTNMTFKIRPNSPLRKGLGDFVNRRFGTYMDRFGSAGHITCCKTIAEMIMKCHIVSTTERPREAPAI